MMLLKKILYWFISLGLIFIGIKAIIDKHIILKGNIINLDVLSYPVGISFIILGIYIIFLLCKDKEIEF